MSNSNNSSIDQQLTQIERQTELTAKIALLTKLNQCGKNLLMLAIDQQPGAVPLLVDIINDIADEKAAVTLLSQKNRRERNALILATHSKEAPILPLLNLIRTLPVAKQRLIFTPRYLAWLRRQSHTLEHRTHNRPYELQAIKQHCLNIGIPLATEHSFFKQEKVGLAKTAAGKPGSPSKIKLD